MREVMLSRQNGMGLKFSLFITDDNKTKIICNRKHIIVDMPIEEVSKCWFDWQQKGMLIQDAFPKLSPDEREFFQTGIDLDEWDRIFEKYKVD